MIDRVVVRFIPPTRWWRRANWELTEEFTSLNDEVSVPIGFITDGASIPWIFRLIFSPTGKAFSAAIVHDYILSTVDWDYANKQFEAELDALEMCNLRAGIMLSGVKAWAVFLDLIGKNSINDK